MRDHAVDGKPLDTLGAEQGFPFAGLLDPEDLLYLGALVQWHGASTGECLWREGDLDDRLGLIVRGRVKLLKRIENSKHPLILGLFGPGSLVSDFAFLEEGVRETSACAVEDLEIVFLSRAQFEKLLAERPKLGHRILGEVLNSAAEQLRNAYRRLAVFL